MSTVLIIEDDFLAGYELEYLLKARGYEVQFAAMPTTALRLFGRLNRDGALAAVVCDNRLLGNRPSAAALYAAMRAESADVPFIVYSGAPPLNLPTADPRLRIVRKPFVDAVVALVAQLAPAGAKARPLRPAPHSRDAA